MWRRFRGEATGFSPVSVTAGKSPVPGKPSGTEIVATPIPRAEGGLAGSRWQTRHIVMAALALVLVPSGIYGVRSLQRTKREKSAPSIEAASVHARRSVAVIGFRNLPGHPEDNWLSSAFAEMLNTELAADGALRMVSGEDVARAKRELPLSDEDSLAKTTLVRLHTDSGADVVVLGSYTPLPGNREKRIRLDIRLQDTNRGETVTEQAFVGSEDDLFELVGQAGAALRRSLGTEPASLRVSAQARAALPTKPLAVRLYTEGQASLWAFDFTQARALLIQTVSVEPDFPLSHAALSETWKHLGYNLKARDEADLARGLSEHLGPEQRLLIEGQYYVGGGDGCSS